MRIYIIQRNFPSYDWCKRVGALHDLAFHGIGEYRSLAEWKPHAIVNENGERAVAVRPPDWRWPGVTNANREPLHIARSGAFVPDVFGSLLTSLIVSSRVREAMSTLPNIGFNRVVFEQLVDLPMPSLGDFSWVARDDLDRYKSLPKNAIRSLPHEPKFEKRFAEFVQLLPGNSLDLADRYADVKSYTVNFGTFAAIIQPKELSLSLKMFEEFPIIQSPHWAFREDAFGKIAPFLDLDYYGIAVLHLE